MIYKTLNISDFLQDCLQSCKKSAIFITKNCNKITSCFTTNHNLGMISDIAVNTFEEAQLLYNKIEYSNNLYISSKNNKLYLSYNDFHNPILTRHISKQETDTFIIYRYLIVDNQGILLNSIIIKRNEKV